MMLFVALHEFAHIKNRDIDCNFWKNVRQEGLKYENNSFTGINKRYRQEELADQYAIERLGDWHDSSSNVWSNFAQAYLLMNFLEVMENKQGELTSATHPPAKLRKERMLMHAQQFTNHSPPYDYAAFVERLVDTWANEIEEQ